jgi:multiple sugar transport system ATP-binding protein
MGRAIVRDPEVFLFDEPLSNLDAKLRVQMRAEIKALHQRLKTTTIYVTHDQVEAMTMADRIVVMRDGVIEQVGSPLDLYDQPANLFVAGFIGSPTMNFIDGRIEGGRFVSLSSGIQFAAPAGFTDGDVVAGIRPNEVAPSDGGTKLDIMVIEPLGAETQLVLNAGGIQLVALVQGACRSGPERRSASQSIRPPFTISTARPALAAEHRDA